MRVHINLPTNIVIDPLVWHVVVIIIHIVPALLYDWRAYLNVYPYLRFTFEATAQA